MLHSRAIPNLSATLTGGRHVVKAEVIPTVEGQQLLSRQPLTPLASLHSRWNHDASRSDLAPWCIPSRRGE